MKKPQNVMVIDDNPINLKLICDLLSLEGYEVQKCFNADEALVLLQMRLPEIILMDVALPGMDGLTLTRKLKAEHRTKDITIIAVTAFAMKGDEEKVIAAGCDGFITKPINTRTFITQISTYLT